MKALQQESVRDSQHLHQVDERDLWDRREEPRIREELVRRYLNFSHHLASRYRKGSESFDDLVQVASLGLLNAIDRFDPDKGAPFAAFAAPTIHGELKRYFRDRIWMVRVPRGIQEEIMALDHAVADLGAQLHRDPTPDEIVGSTALDFESVERASRAKGERVPVSLDSPVTDDGVTRGESFGFEDPGFHQIEDRDRIRQTMAGLDEEQRLVMRLRFIEEMTQSEIAERIGCSQMHISRLIRRTINSIPE